MFRWKKTVDSNKDQFERKVESDIQRALGTMGRVGVNNIKSGCPVDTGLLRLSNDFELDKHSIIFYNSAYYAPFVEFGTVRNGANPFMRKGINNSISQFNQIIMEALRV